MLTTLLIRLEMAGVCTTLIENSLTRIKKRDYLLSLFLVIPV